MKTWQLLSLSLALVLPAAAADGRREINQGMIPYTLSEPGSYVVTENLTSADDDAITIAAHHVTLDLNGFLLEGGAQSLSAVAVSGTRQDITVRNGIIRGWKQEGMDMSSASNCVIRSVRFQDNTGSGLEVGPASLVQDCTALRCGSGGDDAGLVAGEASLVADCIVRENGNDGLRVGAASTIRSCVARSNSGDGLVGGEAVNVMGCTARGNSNDGIVVEAGSRVSDCVAFNNDEGIRFNGNGGSVVHCTLYGNSNNGLRGGDGLMVLGCTAYQNTLASFAVSNSCYLVSNNAIGQDATPVGYQLDGNYNRAERNHGVRGSSGFKIDGNWNLVIKNSATQFTDEYNNQGANNRIGAEVSQPSGAGAWDNLSY